MTGERRQALAYLLLRATMGGMLLFYGVGKLLRGLDAFRSGLQERFAQSWLPGPLVGAFATALPFAEVVLGSLLLLGLFRVPALVGAALLMMGLTFGAVVEPSPPTVAANVTYAFVLFALLWLADRDRYHLDALRPGAP